MPGTLTDQAKTISFNLYPSSYRKLWFPIAWENVGGAAGTAVVNDAYTGCIMNLSTGEIRTLFDDGQQDIVMFKDGNAADVSFSAIFPEQTFSAADPFVIFDDSKEFKLSADRLFESEHVVELPFMGKILEYQFAVTPIEKNISSKGGTFNLAIASKKYYSVNGTLYLEQKRLLIMTAHHLWIG